MVIWTMSENIIYIEKTDIHSTLTTWIYCHMWQLYAAEKMGLRAYINWPGVKDPGYHHAPQTRGWSLLSYQDPAMFAQRPNMFEWYFKQPHLPGPPPPRNKTWVWENCPESGLHPLMAKPLAEIKEFYRNNLFFSDEVNQRGQALVDKYKFNFDNTLAVSWRGTDTYLDGRPRLPIDVYFPFIDQILEREPSLSIFATAEETGVLDPLLKRYPQAFTVSEFFSAPFGCKENPERFSPFSGYERGMQPALLVWILSKCRHYVKNRSSVGMVASWLSKTEGDIVCIAHPENAGFGFDLKMAEIKGKLFPLSPY
jgi:hypothetical protein